MTRLSFLSVLVFLLALSVPSLSYAKGDVQVGDTIPHDLNVKDQTGKERNFSNLKGDKGLVLVFVRSVEWCPFCQKQLIELSTESKKINDAGYSIVSVSYDGLDQIQKFSSKHKPKITMLSDPSSEIIRAFDILNTANAKGTFSYGIPYPGTYIISKDKKVQAKFFNDGFKDRVSPSDLLAKIKKLNPPPAPNYLSLDEMGTDPIVPGQDVIDIPEKITAPALPEVPQAVDMVKPEALSPETDLPVKPIMPEAGVLEKIEVPNDITIPEAPEVMDPVLVKPTTVEKSATGSVW